MILLRCLAILLIALLPTGRAFAEPFAPTMLKIEAEPMIAYHFDNDPIDIPVKISGTACQLIFCIFTNGFANEIKQVQNGYLGWHYVNTIDTCIYFSAPYNFEPGANVVTWDVKDQVGNYLSADDFYTYYMWAFDNQSEKQMMSESVHSGWAFDYTTEIQAVDEAGLPMASPIWYRADSRWAIGGDPYDKNLLETSNIILDNGWKFRGDPKMDALNFDYFYLSVGNKETQQGSIQKIKWVPNGDAEIQRDWGENGYATLYPTAGGGSPGIATDSGSNYLYTADENHVASNEPDADFYIYDMDGLLVTDIDLTSWWSSKDDYDVGAQMNGGPTNFTGKHDYVLLNCHCNCLNQMVAPYNFLETGNPEDFYVWSNGNGDYVLDHNFEETATLMWVCNDWNVGPYKYSISADDNLFSIVTAYDLGTVSFGLLAPYGTGLGYYAFAGETADTKKGTMIIDSDTPFDGIYCDDERSCPPNISCTPEFYKHGIYFIGHDSITGNFGIPPDCFGPPGHPILSPVEGDRLVQNKPVTIEWYLCPNRAGRIEFTSDGGSSWSVIDDQIGHSIRYNWTVPPVISDSCMIRIFTVRNPDFPATSGMFSIVSDDVGVDDDSQPLTFTLSQNSPNPFNPVTSIPFTLPKDSAVTLTVYSITGGKVATLVDATLGAGSHSVDWDASAVGSGMYFARLRAGEYVETVKMTVVK